VGSSRRCRAAHRSLAASLTVSLLLVAGCGAPTRDGAAPPDAPVTGGPAAPSERGPATIRVALGRDPLSIDPRHVADDEGEQIVRALFDGLVDLAPDGSIVAAAASSWTVEDDGLTYRFLLRDDRFHDGTTVTAMDHATALLGVLDPDRAPLFRQDLLAALLGADGEDAEAVLIAGGIEVVGPRELVLRLARPDPLLLHRLTDPVLVPLPSRARTDADAFALEPIGNGPFRMLGPREPGAFIRLTANTAHPRPPRIDGLVLQVYAADLDREQRWADLLAGRLQITAIPPDRRDEARERFGVALDGRRGRGLYEEPGASVYAYGFAIDVAPFDDPVLRRAVSAAIDREAMAFQLRAAGVEPAHAILAPALGGTAVDCAHCRYDPVLAAELISVWRASLPEGMVEPRVTLAYPRGDGHVAIAERIASDVERVLGLDVRLQSRDLGALVRAVTAGEVPLFRYGMRASLGGQAAAGSLLDPAFRPGAEGNWVRWADPATVELLDALGTGADPSLARTVEAAVLDAAAVVPLLWSRPDLVVHPDVVGFRLDVTGRWWPELLRLR
jgi:oligopeptide transport system substrate-binding protein